MNIRDQKILDKFQLEMEDYFCSKEGIFANPISRDELADTIRVFIDVLEMKTDYNCNKDDDISLFKATTGRDKFVEQWIQLRGCNYLGLEDYITRYVVEYFDTGALSAEHFELLVTKVEPFLEKVIHVINKVKNIDELAGKSNHETEFNLGSVFIYLGKKPNSKGVHNWDSLHNLIKKVTDARNEAGHVAGQYNNRKIANDTDNILSAMLWCIYINKDALSVVLDDYRKANVWIWSKDEKEKFLKHIIESYETPDSSDKNEKSPRDTYVRLRVKTFDQNTYDAGTYRDMVISSDRKPRCIMLYGKAGTGKSTIINQFEYQDAKACLEGLNKSPAVFLPVPVKIQLGDIQNDDILNAVRQKLNYIEEENTVKLLKQGEIHLYLDALDELMFRDNLYNTLKNSIKNLLNVYQNCFIILTGRNKKDRPDNISDEMVCELMPMNLDEKKNIIGAYASKEIAEAIIKEIINNANYDVFTTSPLMLKMVIEYFTIHKAMPQKITELTRAFLNSLFDREYNKSHGYLSVSIMMGMLRAIHPEHAKEDSQIYNDWIENAKILIPEEYVLEKFTQKAAKLGIPNFDSPKLLQKMIDLKVLERIGYENIAYAYDEYAACFMD